MAMTKIKGLQMWCKKMTEGYPLVDITNFTTAWRDGLAFCAIIHRFRPDLIDFHSLSPDNVFENCKMAFEIAERELNIPAFLEAEDMVRLKVPDKLSIITYVSQYYNYLHALPQLGGPAVRSKISTKISGTKRPTDSDSSQAPITKKATTESKENMAPAIEKQTAGGDKCAICENHVYLVERHMDSGKLYHRSCFRRSEMSPANKVLTRSPFLSPTLSFDTPSSISLDIDNKHSGMEKGGKAPISDRQFGIEPKKVAADVSAIPMKVENFGLKHSLNELSMEDTKKSKMEPRMLFNDDKSKTVSATKYGTSAENILNKTNDSGIYLSKSNKDAPHMDKELQDNLSSEKSLGFSKSAAQLKFQLKDTATSNTQRSSLALTAPTTAAAISTVKMDIPTTKSTASTSKTSTTLLPAQSDPGMFKYKLTRTEDTHKSSFQSESDPSLSKVNALQSVQNRQKTFSGKSDSDLSEPSKPSQPVARPRSGTLKSIVEDSSSNATPTKPALTATVATPKAAPRRGMLDISTSATTVTPKQRETPTSREKYFNRDGHGLKTGALKLPTADLAPPIPKAAPPPLPTSVPAGNITSVTGDKDFKRPSADKLLQDTKGSPYPTKSPEDPKSSVINASPNPYQRIDSSKPTGKESITNNHPGTSSSSSDDKVLSGLLSSLAGIRSQTSNSGHTNHPSQSPVKIPTQSYDTKGSTQPAIVSMSSSRTPVPKANTPSSSAAQSQLNSTSQTDILPASRTVNDSNRNHINFDVSNVKPKAEKSVVIQGRDDATISGKASSNIQTPNKTQDSVGTPKITHPASATPGNNITRTEIKLSLPEKRSNDSNSALSNTDVHIKESTTSKAQPQKNNQNSNLKFTDESAFSLKNAEKKSQYAEIKYDSKSSSTADAKRLSYSTNKILSSSKEDLLDINSVKLRVVMPEQKKPPEPKTAVYDVKLKKVEVIKGDTKWDNNSDQPLKSLNSSEGTTLNKNAGFNAFPGNKTEGVLPREEIAQKSSGSVLKQPDPSVGKSQKSGIPNELPLWKKDIEKNKNSGKSQSQSQMNQREDLKRVEDKKMAITTERKLDLNSKMKVLEIQNASEEGLPVHCRPGDIKSVGKDLVTNGGPNRNSIKLSPSRENKGNGNKLDWQLEAEKRMAALAGFDLEVVEKLKQPIKLDLASNGRTGNQQNKMASKFGMAEGDISTRFDKTGSSDRKLNIDQLMSGDSNAEGKGTMLEKTATKSKESGLEFVLNKTKLKPIEVDISILPEDETHQTHDRRSKGDDFREILHQLKRVPALESGKMDTVKSNIQIDLQRDTTAHDTHPMKSSQNNNVNKNNNRPTTSDQILSPGVDINNKLSKDDRTPVKPTGFQGSTGGNGNEKKNQISELPKEKLAVGKQINEKDNGRIKITTQGNTNKNTAISPPSTPKQKKKIQVTKKFDFEQSSDFEHSLTNSVAGLTIQDKHTTPPARTNQEGMSPNHISAIELQNQLLTIDVRLTELELRGRKIEESIRKVDSLEDDEDQLMIEWFSVINEKNDLVRKEADLIYISREQDLETEQDKIEHQLRYLMSKPDECKSPEEKEEEDYLLKHKLTLVEQRNKIIDSMDEDRIRYEDEDRGIEVTLKKKGFWKDSTGTLKALKGKKVAKSVFYT